MTYSGFYYLKDILYTENNIKIEDNNIEKEYTFIANDLKPKKYSKTKVKGNLFFNKKISESALDLAYIFSSN